MEQQFDKETQNVLSDGEKIQDLVGSEGWRLAKKKLFDRLITLDSISSVETEGKSDGEVIREMRARAGVVSLIIEWIRDVEGTAQQSKDNKETMLHIRKESIIQYFE